jgi:phosphoserine phosphatase
MAPYPWRLVTVDIDGTLTTVHGWREIATARGRRREYDRAHRRIIAGIEDEDAHLRGLFAFAEGLTRHRLEQILESTPKLAGISETVRRLHLKGARVALLTHNPPYVTRWYCRSFGFDAGTGGWGSSLHKGRIGVAGRVRADKVRGLRALERKFGVPARSICHVGDAWPDARLAPLVGGFVAFNPDAARVARTADRVVRSRDLRDILPVLDRLAPRRPVNGARPLAEGSNTRPPDGRAGADGVRHPRGAAPQVAEPPPPQRGRRAA